MKHLIVFLFFLFLTDLLSAQEPPFDTLKISGAASRKFNKVALFDNGSDRTGKSISRLTGASGYYRINIDIKKDMIKKGKTYAIDLRFWKDDNNNNIRDKEEYSSNCNFIIWVPALNKVFLQPYGGKRIEITSANFEFNLEK